MRDESTEEYKYRCELEEIFDMASQDGILNGRTIDVRVRIPPEKTMEELIKMTRDWVDGISISHGTHIRFIGYLPASIALYLGNRLIHMCKDIQLYDTNSGDYVRCVWH